MKEPGKCPAPGLIVFNLSIGDIKILYNLLLLSNEEISKIEKIYL